MEIKIQTFFGGIEFELSTGCFTKTTPPVQFALQVLKMQASYIILSGWP
jgi:hypothetical protein